MQKYVVLVIDANHDAWETMTPEQRQQTYEADYAFGDLLAQRGGQVVGGAGLVHPRHTRVLRHDADGSPVRADGPYAETAEQLSGFFIVESPSEDDLLDACERMLPAHGALEIRPVPSDDS